MKGHSERVPNKNIRDFCGRPLFHWVLETLHLCPYVSRVIIDTDSEAIAENALKHFDRVQIVSRPPELCGDHVSMNLIISHDLTQAKSEEHFLQTHSTNPLLTVDTISKAIEAYFAGQDVYDSLFAATRLQTRLYWQDGRPVNHNPLELIRTQDLEPLYEENSNFYLFSRTSFHQSGEKRIGLKPSMFEVDKLESVDIDELHDFTLAEMLCRLKNEKLIPR